MRNIHHVSILENIFKDGYRYQKAGVMLTGLSNVASGENLFSCLKQNQFKFYLKNYI